MRSLLSKVRRPAVTCTICRQDIKRGEDFVQLRTGMAHKACVVPLGRKRQREFKAS